jgi:antitoxin HigA-1
MPNQMRPMHPGEVLKGEMEELGLSARQLAMALGVPTHRVTAIVHETRALTADTVLRLARYFGTAPEFSGCTCNQRMRCVEPSKSPVHALLIR